jgi:tRNA pseudouridine13 synthase
MQVPKLEKQIGIEVYASRTAGIGGTIRENVEDFIVEEVLLDGSKASVESSSSCTDSHALGCSTSKTRHLLCTLIKRNWDTLVAVNNIARQLGIGMQQIHFAGIKDARALTAQHITVEDASLEQIQNIRIKDMVIRPLGYLHNKLSAYYLLGNSFRIRINAVNHSKMTIEKRIGETVEELQRIGGIPNFFGHQRFGTNRPITHLVGKAIIQKSLKEAAMLFLAKPCPHEHPSSRTIRKELWETGDFEAAVKNFPNQLRYERTMLRHLVEHNADFAGAFRRLPFKLQEIFIQAYQSYLFNKFLSRRIEAGLPLNAAEIGDYVVPVERSGLSMPALHKTVDSSKRKEINHSIQTGKLRLAIPLVGFRQRPSQGCQGEIEKQTLEEEHVSLPDFRIAALPEVSTRGRLRAVTTPINDFSLDTTTAEAHRQSAHRVKVKFTLYKGSYATVVLREIMKPKNIIRQGF